MTTLDRSPGDLAKAIILTDDEVIALGARAQQPWPSPIVSVDVTDSTEIAGAALRGTRSLVARGLLYASTSGSLLGDLKEITEPVLRADLVLSTYLVDAKFVFSPVGLATAAYISDDDLWVNEIVAPSGLHYLRQESSQSCIEFARHFVEASFRSGTSSFRVSPDLPIPSFACVMRKWPEHEVCIAAFREDEAFRSTSMLGVGLERESLESFESLQSALSYLDL